MSTRNDKIYFGKYLLFNVFLYLPIYFLNHANFGYEKAKLYFAWETNIPLVGWMIIPYLSFGFLFLFPLFLFPREEIKKLSLAFAFCTVCAGIIFFIFPSEYGFTRIVPAGFTASLYETMFKIDPYVNPFPSLHVAFSFLYLISCIDFLRSIYVKTFLGLWIMVIVASTVFTHQHHILDILSGGLLAFIVYFAISGKPFGKVH